MPKRQKTRLIEKPKTRTVEKPKSKPIRKPNIVPRPMTVEVDSYKITTPDDKKCWRARVVYSCGHPMLLVFKVKYLSYDKNLVIKINLHGKP